MDAAQKIGLIKQGTAEIVTEEELAQLIQDNPHPTAYFGVAVTGKVHIGYFVPLVKIRDFLEAGLKVKILLADIHAHLDDQKTPFELLDKRVKYYKQAIAALLTSIGADVQRIQFVKGSDFQLSKEYTTDMYRLAARNTLERTRRAASEVVRFGSQPKLSGFIYPILQALDEQYLAADIQLGGLDQRKILMFCRENLPRIGYKARIEIMTPMLPGLTGEKMSASRESTKIDILEDEDSIRNKVKSFYCPEGKVENNGVLAFAKQVIFPLSEGPITVERPAKFGGPLTFETYAQLEESFTKLKVHPLDLKSLVADQVQERMKIVRKQFKGKDNLIQEAFPEKKE